MAHLPPGLTEKQFAEALAACRRIVGDQWVITTDDEGLAGYRDPYTPYVAGEAFEPAAAVLPASVEEVQALVKIANDHGISFWTFSTGRNFAYGGAAPRMSGSVCLDLKRMNRIIEVNEKFAYALVEPGVTYRDLHDHLRKTGSRLWIDCAAPAWGGVMGNAVDRGAGYTPYGDHWMMQCGLEVVLADGLVVRTGMGAMPGNNTWQLFKYGYGPYVDGIFTQSNFGIVTKMGIWLMPEPPGYRPYLITFDNDDDIHDVIEVIRPLRLNMIIPNSATAVELVWDAAVTTTRRHYHTGTGALPPAARRKLASDLDAGIWNFYGALYGPPARMDADWSVIRDAFSSIKGARFFDAEQRKGDVAFDYRAKLMRGEPNMTEFSVLNWTGGGGHLGFAPISPPTGEDALKQYRLARTRHEEFGLDYMGEFIIGWREMHHVMLIIYDRTDPGTRERADALFKVLVADAAKAGYGEYRTHLAYMDRIAGTYDWNDGALWKLHERLKDALDPHGILSPGKQGIWPKKFRDGGSNDNGA